MEYQEHWKKLIKSCLHARISQFLNRRIEILEAGVCRIDIPFNPDLTQNSSYLHGAMLFEAADTAGFVATNSVELTYSVLTVDYHINFVSPVFESAIYAIGTVASKGRRIMVAKSEVFDAKDKLVAVGQGTYIVSNIRLDSLPHYC